MVSRKVNGATEKRGQAFTLEGVFASLILLTAVLFAINAVAITPLTSSTSSERVQNQQTRSVEGFLQGQFENGNLKDAVLFWNNDTEKWHNSSSLAVYSNGTPQNDFGRALNRTFSNWGVAVNVAVKYSFPERANGRISTGEVGMVTQGSPSSNAVKVSKNIVLYDTDKLRRSNGSRTNITLNETDNFYAPDASPSTNVYNVVKVEVIVWII